MVRINATLVASLFLAGIGSLSPTSSIARELVVGQSLGLTGGGAVVAKQYQQGAQCYFDTLNKGGGVRGNTIRLVSLDDGGETGKTVENVRALVDREKAFALFGFTSAAGAQAAFPLIEERGVPLVGIASGGLGVRDKVRKTVFHVRAGYTREIEGALDILGTSGLVRPDGSYAFVYNQDAKANLGAFEGVAKQKGVKVAATVAIDRNSADMRSPAAAIVKSNASAIVAITTAKAMGALIKEVRKQGFTGTIVSSSFAGDPLIQEAGPEGVGTIVTHVVPDPSGPTNALVASYRAALSRCGSTQPASAAGLEGFITARVLAEGLTRAGSNPTRPKLIEGIESINKLDLGGFEIDFSPTNREGARFVEYLMIAKNGKLKK